MATPHINSEKHEIAPAVLMPGDPRRAERIAHRVLSGCKLVSDVRGILAFTGTYQGLPLTVMASGMGLPSMMIYATELYRFYNVKTIIRVGTCGAWGEGLEVGDTLAAASVVTDSAVAQSIIPGCTVSLSASPNLIAQAVNLANVREDIHAVKIAPVFSTDYFYGSGETKRNELAKIGVYATEMESSGLYAAALMEGGQALSLLTVSDHFDHPENNLSAEARETCFDDMLNFALHIVSAS